MEVIFPSFQDDSNDTTKTFTICKSVLWGLQQCAMIVSLPKTTQQLRHYV